MSDYNTEFTSDNSFGNPQARLKVPKATTALVMGILSIVCCCGGPLSLIFGAIGLFAGLGGKRAYNENRDMYEKGSYNTLLAGLIMSIIGLLFGLYMTVQYGVGMAQGEFSEMSECMKMIFSDPEAAQECLEELR